MFDVKRFTGLPGDEELGSLSAVILAGGLGTRLRSLVHDRPKVMAMVAGRPFVEWLVLSLQSAGIRHIVFCVGYLGDMIKEYFQDGTDWGIRIDYSCELALQGTGGALRECLPYVQSNPVLILNGDSFCQVNIAKYLRWHFSIPRAASMVVVKTDNAERFGSVRMGKNGLVENFKEKTSKLDSAWINAGMYILSREILASIPLNRPASLEKEVLPLWVHRGLWGFPTHGAFVDMGTPTGLREAESVFAALVT